MGELSSVEHELLGWLLLGAALAFFGIALPFYQWLRKKAPGLAFSGRDRVATVGLAWIDLLVVATAMGFVGGMWWAGDEGAGGYGGENPVVDTVLQAGIALGVGSLVPLLLFWRVKTWEFLGLKTISWGKLGWILPLFLALTLGSLPLMAWLGWPGWVLGLGVGSEPELEPLVTSRDGWLIGLTLLMALVISPIVEEVIFRAYLFPVVKHFTERGFAMVFSGLLFGLVQFNLLGLPTFVIFGILAAWAYERTGSLWVPVICHLTFNLIQMGMILSVRFLERDGTAWGP